MKRKLTKNDIRGIVGAALFHTLLLLCLIFFGFKTPLPLPEEEGIEIDLGGGGGGSSAPTHISKPASSDDSYMTQNSEEAPSLNNHVNKVTDKNQKTEPKEPEVDPRLIYRPGQNTKPGDGTGTGTGSGTGSGTGPGKGSGIGDGVGSGVGNNVGPAFSLSGRKALLLPTPSIANAQGKVVVRIKVDREGNVVDAETISRGTSIANSQVWRVCEDFARKSKFDAKPDAAEIQMGTITYVII